MYKKDNILFICLGGFFVCNAIVAEIIGNKIFSLEKTLGFAPLDLTVLGQEHISLNLSVGSILWPFVFVMTDIINEYYGKKGVRFLSFLTATLILYAFGMIYFAMKAAPADFWLSLNNDVQPDVNFAFQKIFGQGMNIILGSLVAFLVSQWLDVLIFQRLRHLMGGNYLGVRAVVSTLFSQLIDSFLVAFIAFYLLGNWSLSLLFALLIVTYPYKLLMAIAMTPILYLVHGGIERYLGKELAMELKNNAR